MEDQPSLEMLEFLATFSDDQGNWIDPMELLAMDDAELRAAAEQEERYDQ